jgi:hypothetical protein
MHLAVDDTGQDMQSGGIDDLARGGIAKIAAMLPLLIPISRNPTPSWLTTIPLR